MTTDTKQFQAGLLKATAGLRAFASAANSLGKQSSAMSIGAGFYAIAKGAKTAFDESAKFAALAPLALSGGFKILKGAGKEAADALRAMGGGLAQMARGFLLIGGGIGKAAIYTVTTLARTGFVVLSTAIKSTVGFVREAVNELGLFAAVTGGVATIAVWKLVKAGSALYEQTSRTKNQFGAFAGTVIKESKIMADAFGVPQKEFLQFSSSFAAIFEGAGYTGEAVAKLSTHFVRLANDLASYVDIPVGEALEKLQSGLAGQVRPLREVGVFMSEDAIKAYAAAHGIGQLNKDLTESEKVQARVGFITQGLAKAHGDLARTADDAANSMRAIAGRTENLMAELGGSLLRVVGPALNEINVGLAAIGTAWENSALSANNAAMGTVNAAQGQAQAIGFIQKAIGFVADEWQVLGLGFKAVQSYITWGLGKIVEGLAIVAEGLDKVGRAFGKDFGLKDFFKTWGEDLNRLSGEQWKKFQEELAKPPAHMAIDDAFDQAKQKIIAARKQAMALNTDVSKFKPGTAIAKTEIQKNAEAMAFGSQEAANTILRSQFGANVGNRPAIETAANTRQANAYLKKIADMKFDQQLFATVGFG
jgi:hypothetical protein